MDNPFGFTLRPESPVHTGLGPAWEDLAAAAECSGSPSGRELALRINENRHVAQFTPAIANMLHDMLKRFVELQGVDDDAVRLSELVIHLEPKILTASLRTEQNRQRRNSILLSAVKVLSIRATMRLARSASEAYNQPFSKPLRSLMRKVARTAVSRSAPGQADAQLLFRQILAWKFSEVRGRHGDATKLRYKDLFAQAPRRRQGGRATPEAERIVQTAIELDAVGEVVWVAVTEMIEAGQERDLLSMLKGAPSEARVSGLIIGRIAHPNLLQKLLDEERVDFEAVDLILDQMGIAAAKVLLEALAESRARVTRREVFHRLVKLGTDVGPMLEVRLKDRRWFVLRNMIALAREAGCLMDWHLMQPFLTHKDARVRREALLLLLRQESTSEAAIVKALEDTEPNVLRSALQAARTRMPGAAIPVLAERVRSTDFPPEFRVLALQLLGRSNSTFALDAHLHFTQVGKSFLGTPKLAAKSPEMLAGLSNLARMWPGDRRVVALLASARKSKDDQIASAARAQPRA
ncbi:MAG: hypothetical protein ACREMQ_20805 [Longimicrobiales bacterium]